MKYNKLTGIILKKQNYREADQIITIWTREEGKIRCLAKGLRKPQSKLAYNLQDLSLIFFEIVRSHMGLPTVISAQTYKNFRLIREDLNRTAAALVAVELLLKTTADEQPNVLAFDLLANFFNYLSSERSFAGKLNLPLQSFSLKLLSILGFGIKQVEASEKDLLELLKALEFSETENLKIDLAIKRRLHDLVNGFVEGVTERNLKSQAFLLDIYKLEFPSP